MSNESIQYRKMSSFIYNAMLMTERSRHFPVIKQIWNVLWKKSVKVFSGPVYTTIHGHKVFINYGYTYPFIARQHRTYNDPIIELAHLVFDEKKSKLTILDVGAAVGDTMLCLLANCPNMIEDFACIDGSDEFYQYLKFNLRTYANATLINAFLSSSVGQEKSLVKIHPGTASSQGNDMVTCTTLDNLLDENFSVPIDLIKLDTDGFDGRILAGGIGALTRYKPAVFFEWHPLICQQVQNSWSEHFEILASCGYQRFLWFDNYGRFSHFMAGYDLESVSVLARLLINKEISHLAYFDVVALHGESQISSLSMAALRNAKQRYSWI